MTLRVGLIGCGAVARRFHLPALKAVDGVDVVAFASRSQGSAEAAAAEWGGGKTTTDWREILADVDAVDICTPNGLHAEQAVAAAEAGKHVLVEKPMARTVSEADAMIAASEQAGVVLQVAHNVRYAAPFVAARLAAPRIGELVGFRAAFGHSGPQDWAPDSDWFFDPGIAGGGVLLDLGIHVMDLLRFVTGDEVVEVGAMTRETSRVEDSAQVILRLRGGAVGSVHASWVARPAPDHQLTLFGTEGLLHLDGRTALTFRPATGDEERVELPDGLSNPYADFVRTIAGERVDDPVPAPTDADGRAALAIVCGAYEAARSGTVVRL